MRTSTAAEAVARGPSPDDMSMARCLLVGGAEQSWLVARSKESVTRLESSAALLCDALSLSIPIRCVSFVMLHKQKRCHRWRVVSKYPNTRNWEGSVWLWPSSGICYNNHVPFSALMTSSIFLNKLSSCLGMFSSSG